MIGSYHSKAKCALRQTDSRRAEGESNARTFHDHPAPVAGIKTIPGAKMRTLLPGTAEDTGVRPSSAMLTEGVGPVNYCGLMNSEPHRICR